MGDCREKKSDVSLVIEEACSWRMEPQRRESSTLFRTLPNASEKGSASPTFPRAGGSVRNNGSHGPRLSVLMRKVTFHTVYILTKTGKERTEWQRGWDAHEDSSTAQEDVRSTCGQNMKGRRVEGQVSKRVGQLTHWVGFAMLM